MNRQDILTDLTPFADIGSGAVKVNEKPERTTIRLTRDGRPLKIVLDHTKGNVQSTWGNGQPKHFPSISRLLASEVFANLKRWADVQQDVLRRDVPSGSNLLPIHAVTHTHTSITSIDDIDNALGTSARAPNATEVLLIDGSAGIGKTSLIAQLALRRAASYKLKGRQLILHVKSRGRVLSNLQDLMAFSLQTIRSSITYDQLPILAKHGLVIIAIDGFDELADPNGYQMAWSQLGELVEFVRGQGTLILAGRDTFFGRSTLLDDVDTLRDGIDIVNSITLQSPSPDQAKAWFKRHQWTEANLAIPSISVLLEADSFALRPVFLTLIARYIKPKDVKGRYASYLIPFLVDRMIHREAKLFGKPVESIMDAAAREKFLLELLHEVARDMADSQTESIEATELAWLSEAALGDGKSEEVVSLIRNRAGSIGFFINDDRPGYKAFMHSYLLNYFASQVTIMTVAVGEIPKFVRRNILGSEFLSVFSEVIAALSVEFPQDFAAFWDRVKNMPFSYRSSDRGLRNTGALALAALPSVISDTKIELSEFQIDDAVIHGTCPNCTLKRIDINQLDSRGADFSSVDCSEVRIESLLADDALRVGPSFPTPKKILLSAGQQVVGSTHVNEWLAAHGRDPAKTVASGLATDALRGTAIYALLRRVARTRQYWLREDSDDIPATKILSDPDWPRLSELLAKFGYLRREVRQASGRASSFYHIKHGEDILREATDDANLKRLFDALSAP